MATKRRKRLSGGGVSPFVLLAPRLWLIAWALRLLARFAGWVWRSGWPYRRELLTLAATWWLTAELANLIGHWALVLVLIVVGGLLTHPRTRGAVLGWWTHGVVRRRLDAAFEQTRSTTLDGALPRVTGIRATPIGYRVSLRLRPGHSAELLTGRTEEFRAALRCRDIRVHRNPDRSDRVTLDIVRTDPLTTGNVEWADQNKRLLSIWDPIHLGLSEFGTPVRVSVVERVILIGGNRGAGKSSAMNVFATHAAKSPDVELLLIDANRVQLVPWADRALVFAHRVDDAVDVVRLWRDEIDRRLDLFTTLPGKPLSLTRDLARERGLPMWLLFIDELAYHTSVAGTPAQQKEFYNLLRDGVARGRAAGMGAIVATQRPTHDLVPTSLRDLFDIRIAFRTMTTTSSDVILGNDYAAQGFNAADIYPGARGVCWLLADDPTPVRMKTVWIPPGLRQELAVTTVWNRPSRPDQRPSIGGLDGSGSAGAR